MSKNFIRNQKAGFVILFAIIVSSTLLLIGAGIYAISLRETILTTSARDSQLAFYASDTGLDCGIYQDAVVDSFDTGQSSVTCAEQSATVNSISVDGYDYEFQLQLGDGCAVVSVDIDYLVDSKRIRSRGFNRCDPSTGPETNNPFLVERVLRATYTVN